MSLQDGATDSMIFLSLFVGAKVELQTKGSKSAKFIASLIASIEYLLNWFLLLGFRSCLPKFQCDDVTGL